MIKQGHYLPEPPADATRPRIRRFWSITQRRWYWQCIGDGRMGWDMSPRLAYSDWVYRRYLGAIR